MSKYIDAEKLKAGIERRKNEWQALIDKNSAVNLTAVKEVIYEDLNILDIITSLQQEQPADGDDGKFVKILVRKEFAEQFQRLGDEIQAGQSSFIRAMNRQEQPQVADASKMEQPDVDLEKEMNKLVSLEYVNQPDDKWDMCIARHFYELGLNARNEE